MEQINLDIKSLELENTIKIFRNNIKVLKRPKGNILLFTYEYYLLMSTGAYYINNIKYDIKNNDIIFDKERNITEELGEQKNIFDFFNYKESGFVTITDNNKTIIYDNYYY